MEVAAAVISALVRQRWTRRRCLLNCTCDALLASKCRGVRLQAIEPNCACDCHRDAPQSPDPGKGR